MISFTVYGTPRPAGSKRAFVRGGRAMVVDANPQSKPWKQEIAGTAAMVMGDEHPFDGALSVRLMFVMSRPQAHYLRGEVRGSAPLYHVSRPDVDKLSRAVLDSLTGIVWRDDAQVAVKHVKKVYGEHPGVTVHVEPAIEVAA